MKEIKPDVGFLILLAVCRQWSLHSNAGSSIKISYQPQIAVGAARALSGSGE